MSIEVSKFDILYSKLLLLNFSPEYAKELAGVLYKISNDLDLTINDILKYINEDGFQFNNDIYKQLNDRRSKSSQIGRLEQDSIPSFITQQLINNNGV